MSLSSFLESVDLNLLSIYVYILNQVNLWLSTDFGYNTMRRLIKLMLSWCCSLLITYYFSHDPIYVKKKSTLEYRVKAYSSLWSRAHPVSLWMGLELVAFPILNAPHVFTQQQHDETQKPQGHNREWTFFCLPRKWAPQSVAFLDLRNLNSKWKQR